MHNHQATNAAGANIEQGGISSSSALDENYDNKCGLAKPMFDMGAGFMSGMPDGKFACEEIEVFVMKPQQA